MCVAVCTAEIGIHCLQKSSALRLECFLSMSLKIPHTGFAWLCHLVLSNFALNGFSVLALADFDVCHSDGIFFAFDCGMHGFVLLIGNTKHTEPTRKPVI